MSNNAISGMEVDLKAKTSSFSRDMKNAGRDVRDFSKNTQFDMKEARGSLALLGEEVGVHKMVYDPRTSSTAWSNNAALCLRDWLVDTKFGLGVDPNTIDDDSVSAAANVCDEDIDLREGGTQKRYTCDGVIDAATPTGQVAASILASMAGVLVPPSDAWRMFPGAYRDPVLEITDDDLRASLKLDTGVSRRDTANSVKGTYVSPVNKWQPSDYPPYQNSGYVAQDGGEVIWTDLTFDFVTDPVRAQRLAKIHLEKKRRKAPLVLQAKIKAFQVEAGDTIEFTHARWGFSAKTYIVTNTSLLIDNKGGGPVLGYDMVCYAADSNIYSWDPDVDEGTVVEVDAPLLPNSSNVGAPTDLALESDDSTTIVRADGIAHSQIKVTWTAPTDIHVLKGGAIEIFIKLHTDSDYTFAGDAAGTDTVYFIDKNIKDGYEYDVLIRSLNTFGAHSFPISDSVVVSSTASSISGYPSGEVTSITYDWEVNNNLPPDGWELVGTPTLSYDITSPGQGVRSLIIDTSTQYDGIRTKTKYTVIPGDYFTGERWKIGALLKDIGATGESVASWVFFDATDTEIGRIEASLTDNGDWTPIVNSGAVTSDAVYARIYLQSYSTFAVTLGFDSVQVLRIASLEDEVSDGPERKAMTAANGSYRPLTNPLTAIDAGSYAEIDIASFTMRVAVEVAGGHDVSLNSGSITGLDYATVYHVYYDDPSYTGGAVTYSADTDQYVALDAEGRFYVGSILTPVAGGQATVGNNDGGTGAQSGKYYKLWPTFRGDDRTDPVSFYPVNSEDTDGDDTTYVTVLGQELIWLATWPQITDKWVSLKLQVRSEVIDVGTGGVAFVDYSLDGGTTWQVLYDVANGTTDVESGASGANSGTGTDWTNVSGIVDSSSQATVTALAHGDSTKYAYASDYGFALPSGAIPLGIVVQFDETLSGSSFVVPPTFNVQLFDATGTPVGTVKTATAVEDGTIRMGDTEDLWESSWAYSDINNSNFGVGIQAVAPHVTTDWAADTYYSPDGLIIDSNGNLQQLYTPGTTGGSAPTWATTLSATTSDGSAVWVCVQLSASLTWAAHTHYSAGQYVKATVAGTDYLYKLTKIKVPHLKSGATNGWFWYGSSGAGTSSGAFNKLYPVADPGSAQHFANVRSGGSERPVFYWANPVSVNTKFKNLNGAGESTADTDTGRYENWQMAQVGYVYLYAGTWSINISHDDGMLIGFGTQLGGAGTITKVSGDLYAPARSVNNDFSLPTTRTARMGYQLFAGQNRAAPGSTLSTNLVITVSATGYYPVELDWSNWEHAGSLRVRYKDATGTLQDLVPNTLNVAQTDTTLDVSGVSAPTFPAFSNSFAPSYASVYESAGQYQWLCLGAVADFTWYSSTDYARAGQVIIDANGNGQVAYRPGKSNASAAPFFTTTIGGLTDDTGNNLVWKNVGPTVGSATYDFAISNALISVTYQDSSSANSRGLTTDTVILPFTQNLSLVEVRYGVSIQDGEQDFYECFVEGQAG